MLTRRTAARIAILGGVALSLLGVLLVRLWFMQVVNGHAYAARADNNRLRTEYQEAPGERSWIETARSWSPIAR